MKKQTKMAKVLAAILTAAMVASGCGGSQESAQTTEAPSGDSVTIGVIQPLEHPALDAAREGFIAALKESGYTEGENLTLDLQNAQGDTSNLSTISDRFVSKKVDLVLAIATDAAQSVAAKTQEIPIVATAVTSFTTAGLVASEEQPGGNVTGTSDMNPVAAQIGLIQELVPEVETIGLLYNSSEDNSVLQVDMAKKEIEALGLKWSEVTVVNSNDIQTAMQSLVTKCQAVYVPTDNTVASAMASVHSVAKDAKIPTICGESNAVMSGGLATMGINYFDLGAKAGKMAVEILNGADPAEMPVQFADTSDEVVINGTVAEEIGFTVPDKYKDFVVPQE